MVTRDEDTYQTPGTALVPGDAQAVFDIPANIIRFGKTSYPADYGFLDGPNNYFMGDAGDTSSDVSFLMRVQGNARWEAGMVGAVTDGVINQSYRIKSITGLYLSEIFSDRFVISDDRNPRYPFVDIHGPPGRDAMLRLYGVNAGDLPMLVIGNSNGEASPTGTGSGLEISYDFNSDIARFSSITHDAFYRDMVFEAQSIRFSTGPVFLNFDALVLNPQGAMLIGHPIQKAAAASISNAGDEGIAQMSGYTIGQILTMLGGTGTPATFTLDQLQVASAVIASAGSGGADGSQVFTIATGATGTQPQFNGTVLGGVLVSIDSWVTHGDLTTDPPGLTGLTITGGGLTGGTVDVEMGAVGSPTLLTAGALTIVPLTPTATSSSGAGVGATLFIQYENGAGTINVEIGVIDDGEPPTGDVGSGYVRANNAILNDTTLINPILSGAVFTGSSAELTALVMDNGAGASAQITFQDGGVADTWGIAKLAGNDFVIYDYARSVNVLYVNPSTGGLTIGETGVIGVAIGAPTGGVPASGSLNIAGDLFSNGVAPTGTGAYVRATTPTLATPVIGVATGTSLALSSKLAASGATLSNTGQVLLNAAGVTPAQLAGYSSTTYIYGMGRGGLSGNGVDIEAFNDVGFRVGGGATPNSGARKVNIATTGLEIRGSTSGGVILNVPAVAGSNTITFPAGTTDFSATGGTSRVLKQTSVGAAITVAQLTYADLASGTTGATATGLTVSGGSLSGNTALPGTSIFNSTGQFGVGTESPDGNSKVQVVQAGATGIMSTSSVAIGSTAGGGIVMTTPNIPTAAGDRLGFNGYGAYRTGTTYQFSLAIQGFAAAAWGAADAGAYMTFSTTPVGSTTRAERLRITSDGLIAVAGATSAFPALKRSSTVLEHRLADDSAFGPAAGSEWQQYGGENGQHCDIKSKTELLTIAAAATTDTTITIPAGSRALFVSTRVTVAIPTAATFNVGVNGAPTLFGNSISTAVNTVDPGDDGWGTAIAAAIAVRITPNLTPAANTGRVRVTIHYIEAIPPTS